MTSAENGMGRECVQKKAAERERRRGGSGATDGFRVNSIATARRRSREQQQVGSRALTRQLGFAF